MCPVAALTIENEVAMVDLDWCIGCGVCVSRCSSQAIRLVEKEQKPTGDADFVDLHLRMSDERAAAKMKREKA